MDGRNCEWQPYPIGFSSSDCPGAKLGQALDTVRQTCRQSTVLAWLFGPAHTQSAAEYIARMNGRGKRHMTQYCACPLSGFLAIDLYNSDCRAYRSRVTGRQKISTSAAPCTASRLYSCALQRCTLLFLFEPCTGVSRLGDTLCWQLSTPILTLPNHLYTWRCRQTPSSGHQHDGRTRQRSLGFKAVPAFKDCQWQD